jgi:hypothetical protein
MDTSDVLDEKGIPVLARASMTLEQAETLRRQGRAGCQVTATGEGQDARWQRSSPSPIPTNVITHLAVPRIVVAAGFKGLVWCADLNGLHALPRYALLR